MGVRREYLLQNISDDGGVEQVVKSKIIMFGNRTVSGDLSVQHLNSLHGTISTYVAPLLPRPRRS
jgi:hypothetical protein